MSHTLQEVAKATGRPYAVVKKHAQRGKLRTTKEGRAVVVTDDDLALYQASEGLERVAVELRVVEGDTTSLREASGEAGNAIARLPPKVAQAILDGIPRTGKGGHGGSPEPFRKATRDIPRPEIVIVEPSDEDPHAGHPVGFAWKENPRWERVSPLTWAIGEASWTWNGMGWEGSGSNKGKTLGVGISPASPYSERRPLSPSGNG